MNLPEQCPYHKGNFNKNHILKLQKNYEQCHCKIVVKNGKVDYYQLSLDYMGFYFYENTVNFVMNDSNFNIICDINFDYNFTTIEDFINFCEKIKDNLEFA